MKGTSDPSTFGSKRFVDLMAKDGKNTDSGLVGTKEFKYDDFDHKAHKRADAERVFTNPIYSM